VLRGLRGASKKPDFAHSCEQNRVVESTEVLQTDNNTIVTACMFYANSGGSQGGPSPEMTDFSNLLKPYWRWV